jgi:hypothetical protein
MQAKASRALVFTERIFAWISSLAIASKHSIDQMAFADHTVYEALLNEAPCTKILGKREDQQRQNPLTIRHSKADSRRMQRQRL